jgi:hypothetical protein
VLFPFPTSRLLLRLWGTTVKDNDGTMVLTGGGAAAGLDWFFAMS